MNKLLKVTNSPIRDRNDDPERLQQEQERLQQERR